ncbi:MAG: HypC/HybG/HupF family hydrogenase formation chaperone [Archaeoglobales archaeon]|nr:HypC/HybG/HupF family hydrogenase formation chaperone [Archaeoglobales archaeon]
MCLGVPAVVVEIDEEKGYAEVDYGDGVLRKAFVGISLDRINRGDLVIVHANVVISKISLEEAEEIMKILKEIALMSDEEQKLSKN